MQIRSELHECATEWTNEEKWLERRQQHKFRDKLRKQRQQQQNATIYTVVGVSHDTIYCFCSALHSHKQWTSFLSCNAAVAAAVVVVNKKQCVTQFNERATRFLTIYTIHTHFVIFVIGLLAAALFSAHVVHSISFSFAGSLCFIFGCYCSNQLIFVCSAGGRVCAVRPCLTCR